MFIDGPYFDCIICNKSNDITLYYYHENVSIMRQLSSFINRNIHYNFNKFDFMKIKDRNMKC